MTKNRILLISIPKSGTYFLSEVLKNLGCHQCYFHLHPEHFEDYSAADLNSALENPQDYKKNVPLKLSLKMIGANSFAVGHLPAANPELAKGGVTRAEIIDGFKLLFLVRDLRRCIISHMHFELNIRKSDAPYKNLPVRDRLYQYISEKEDKLYQMYSSLLPWAWQKEITLIRFEEIMDELAEPFLGYEMCRFRNAVRFSKCVHTLTKSVEDSSIAKNWSDRVEQVYRRRIRSVNRALGYDRDATVLGKLSTIRDSFWFKAKFHCNEAGFALRPAITYQKNS